MKHGILIKSLSLLVSASFFTSPSLSEEPKYKDASQPVEVRVNDLMSRMSLEEKIGQMEMTAVWDEKKILDHKMHEGAGLGAWIGEVEPEKYNSIQKHSEKSRLQIPYLVGVDAAHGHAILPGRTVFPTSISMAATFDPDLIKRAAALSAEEIRASGNNWTFAPSIDIVHDARWGRTGETYGEDPFLSSRLVEAAVEGLQGNLGGKNVIACVKHLLGGGVSIGGVNHGNVEISERMMRSVFLAPFKAAIQAGVLTIMPGHNDINGIPAHANKELLTDIIKEEYGFPGFYITDMGDIENLLPERLHGTATDQKDAVRQAIEAGIDMHMYSWDPDMFMGNLKNLVNEGKISMERIDDATRRILAVKFQLGLFENRYIDIPEGTPFGTDEAKQTALEAARRSIILLKNENNLLPLDTNKYKKILVTGPNADNQALLGDWANPQPEGHVTTLLSGIQKVAADYPGMSVTYSNSGRIKGKKSDLTVETTDPVTQAKILKEGGEINDFTIRDAVDKAKQADLAVVVIGGYGVRSDWGLRTYGESADRPSIDFYGRQVELVQAIHATGTPVVIVIINGKPLNNPWITKHIPAIIDAWEPGMYGGQAAAEILFGKINPSGRLPITIPQTAGHVPQYYYQTYSRTRTGYGLGASREEDKPAYCFGHGLSYTTFDYTDFKVANKTIQKDSPIIIEGTITNTGKRAGRETAMVFIRDLVSSVVTPVGLLKGFTQVDLKPGESKKVNIEIPFQELGLWNKDMKYVVEPGKFEIKIGSSFEAIKFKDTIEYAPQ